MLIVGAGLAGLRAAIAAADAGADVALITKVHPVRSHTCCAQGGINGALGDDDSWEAHMFDTVKGADYLGDQDAIEIMTREAPHDLIELEHMGCPFSRNDDGTIAQRPFGGAGYPRTAYAADISGFVILHTLYEQCLKRGIKVYEEWFLAHLALSDDRAAGVVAIDIRDGRLHELGARAVIFATGPTSRVYEGSSNSVDCTGDGTAIAFRAGLPLMDLEFVQFHPTGLRNGVLVTEGCRGEGAILVNADGERFMARYAPNKMELASRDVVSRAEAEELAAGRGVDGFILLDLRPIGAEKIRTRLLAGARAVHGHRRGRPLRRAHPRQTHAALLHGRHQGRRRRSLAAARELLRGRRVQLRLGARRQSPRRQLAARRPAVRAAGGRGGGGVGCGPRRRRVPARRPPRRADRDRQPPRAPGRRAPRRPAPRAPAAHAARRRHLPRAPRPAGGRRPDRRRSRSATPV